MNPGVELNVFAGLTRHKVDVFPVPHFAVYDPNESTANKWQPLGTFQYNGTVSEAGSLEAIAYDPLLKEIERGGQNMDHSRVADEAVARLAAVKSAMEDG